MRGMLLVLAWHYQEGKQVKGKSVLHLRGDVAFSGNSLLHFVLFLFCLFLLFSFFFFFLCQTPPNFQNALRRNWFILTQYMLVLLRWLMQEGTDCRGKLLCEALYKYSARRKELLVWKDKMDTNGWKAQSTKTNNENKTSVCDCVFFALGYTSGLVRRWAQWKGKTRGDNKKEWKEM